MLVDAHAHLDRYEGEDEGRLERALREIDAHGILTISTAMDIPSYRQALAIGLRSHWVLPTFGIHPWHAPRYALGLDRLGEELRQSPMYGEIGLDFHFVDDASAYPLQRKVFEHFLAAARRQGKVVNVHTKGAEHEVLALLQRYELPAAIIHWYSGPLDVFRKLVAMGAYFTVGVEVLHSEHVRAIAREVPANRLLTETDNPGGPKALIGGPGMPSLITDVVRGLAGTRRAAEDEIVLTVHANLRRIVRENAHLARAWPAAAGSGAGGECGS